MTAQRIELAPSPEMPQPAAEESFIRRMMRQAFEYGFESGKLRAQRVLAGELDLTEALRLCSLIDREVPPKLGERSQETAAEAQQLSEDAA